MLTAAQLDAMAHVVEAARSFCALLQMPSPIGGASGMASPADLRATLTQGAAWLVDLQAALAQLDRVQGNLYPPADPAALEPHYSRHVTAMTAEELTSKSGIAAQLALRDSVIEDLSAALRYVSGRCLCYTYPKHREDCPGVRGEAALARAAAVWAR